MAGINPAKPVIEATQRSGWAAATGASMYELFLAGPKVSAMHENHFRFERDPAAAGALDAAGITGAKAGMALVGGTTVASSRTASVVVLQTPGGTFFLKRYRFDSLRDRIRGMFRGTLFGRSKARREYENLSALSKIGLPVPLPLAFGECRGAVFLTGCFVVTAGIDKAVRADTWLSGPARRDQGRRREAVCSAARLVAMMHRAGYTDGSMTLRNLLVVEDGASIRVFKVDCPKGAFRLPAGRSAIEDLARLEASARSVVVLRERMRFLSEWAGRPCRRARRRIAIEVARCSRRWTVSESARLADADALSRYDQERGD